VVKTERSTVNEVKFVFVLTTLMPFALMVFQVSIRPF